MITGKDVYDVMSVFSPLYVPMFLAYGSVRWWRIFTTDQCVGINRFVVVFIFPFFCLRFIAFNNIYAMNFRFVGADALQKILILAALLVWQTLYKKASFEGTIVLFIISTLPNTLIFGVPIISVMYGRLCEELLVQIILIQAILWYNLTIFMFEYRVAMILISERFPKSASSIASFRVESDVVSLDGGEPIETDTEVGDDGKLHVVLRRSIDSTSTVASGHMTPIASSFRKRRAFSTRGSSLDVKELKFDRSRSDGSTYQHQEGQLGNNGANSRANDSPFIPPVANPRLDRSVFVRNSSASLLSEPVSSAIEIEGEGNIESCQQMPGAIVMTKLILVLVWRKIIRSPSTYATIFGIIWSLISYRWDIKMPPMLEGSITILANAGLGTALFSTGLFMALQPKIIACGKSKAIIGSIARFLIGPLATVVCALIFSLHGVQLKVLVVQAVLPAAIVPVIFAKEYNVGVEVLSTSVIVSMLIGLPIIILYYAILDVV